MNKLRQFITILFVSLTFLFLTNRPASAQTLSLVRDSVQNADGTNFSGKLIISWQGFTSATGSTVAPHSTAINIVNGYLSVLLVPTTNASPGAAYTATYESNDGTVLWTETWQVAPSWTPLTLNQVRQPNGGGSSGSSGGSGSGSTIALPIQITDVAGLQAALETRPQKGSVYNTLHAAMVDASGNVASVSGNNSDCVHVDGNSGPCGSVTGNFPVFVDGEAPSGSADGTNSTFLLSQPPSPTSSLEFYRNGVLQRNGVDYTLSGSTISALAASVPRAGDILTAFYRVAGVGTTVQFSDAETPAGTINGTNTAFSLAYAPSPQQSLQLFKNGILLQNTVDYALSGNNIYFALSALPHSGDILLASYRH